MARLFLFHKTKIPVNTFVMAIIQQKERELRYGKLQNVQQEAAISSNYLRDMIRAYGVDVRYYKLKCPYPEIFKPILDMNKLTMHAYGYDPTPEYEVETPLIVYWQYSDNSLVLNQYGVQPNRVAKCWIDATDFAIAFAKKLSEYKEYKVGVNEIEIEFSSILDFTESLPFLKLNFETDLFSGECTPSFTKSQTEYIVDLVRRASGGIVVDRPNTVNQAIDVIMEIVSRINTIKLPVATEDGDTTIPVTYTDSVPCTVKARNELHLETPHVVPELWKGKQYEDFIDDCWDSYIRMRIDGLDVNRDGSFKMRVQLTGAIIYYDLHVISKYWKQIRPTVGDVLSIPLYDNDETIARFEVVHVVDENNETYMNPFLRSYIWELDMRNYVSSGEKVPEEREGETEYRRLNELINFANSEAGRKMSFYKDHEENIYGGYDKVSGLDGAILAANEKKGVTINSFEKREDKGTPPDSVSAEAIADGSVTMLRIADLVFPTNLSVMLATNAEEDWTRLVLVKTTDDMVQPLSEEPWQHYLRCTDDTLILRLDNRIYRLASMIENCETYDNSPVIKPRRLKRNVYAQAGGYSDQPFNLVDSEESQLDLGNYAETLTGPKAGEEYTGKQIKNSDISRMIWRNTRSYMDVKLIQDKEGNEYYQLGVKFKGDRRNRKFPLAILKA